MAVEVLKMSAEVRNAAGRGDARALRRAGKVPAIIYGGDKANQSVALDLSKLRKELNRGGFNHRLIDLSAGGEPERVLPREVQLHPVTDVPLHVDFLRLTPTSEVRLSVPVVFENEESSPGIRRGGILNVVRHEVELICRADSIPEHLTADLSGLEIGDSLHISSVTLPEHVRPTTERDFTIATIAAPSMMAEESEEGGEAEGAETPAAGKAGDED